MFDSLRSYSNQLPTDIPETMVKSGVFSFVAGTLLSQNAHVGLFLGGVAMTASLVHGLTTPLFRDLVHSNNVKWYQEAAHMLINLGLTQVLINSFTRHRTNLLGGAIITVGLSLLVEGFKDHSLSRNATYIVF